MLFQILHKVAVTVCKMYFFFIKTCIKINGRIKGHVYCCNVISYSSFITKNQKLRSFISSIFRYIVGLNN